MLSVFKKIMMIIVDLLYKKQAYTRCVFYTIQVTPYSRNDSAYDAFFNAATFVGVKGPSRAGSLASGIEGFRKHRQEPAEEGTQQSRQCTVAVWRGKAAKFIPADRLPRYLLEHELLQLIIYTPKFNGWYEAGLLGIINGFSEFTKARITKALEAVGAGKLIAFIINVKSIEPIPHWVVVGIGKEAGDFHVCLMDSVGGAFDSKPDGAPADILVTLERVLTPAHTSFSLVDGHVPSPSGALPSHLEGALSGSALVSSGVGATVLDSAASAAASSPLVGAAAAAMPVGGTIDLGGAVCRVGLVNQGGTCYQNSVLQALHKSFYFRELFARILSDPSIETDAGAGSEIIRQLRDTFVSLGQNDLVAPPGFSNPFYNPISFATEVVDYMGFESLARHQDAQEFMTRLFGLLQLKSLLPDPTFKDYDRTSDNFNAVEYQEELACKVCGYRRMSPPLPDFTYLLSLSIPPGGSGLWPVEELLRAYRNIEDMGE